MRLQYRNMKFLNTSAKVFSGHWLSVRGYPEKTFLVIRFNNSVLVPLKSRLQLIHLTSSLGGKVSLKGVVSGRGLTLTR